MKSIIDTIIPASHAKTRAKVKQMIPILIRWAKNGLKKQTYGDMFRELGVEHYSNVGTALGYIEDVMEELRKETGENIPTLNTLCKNKSSMLPSYGFKYVVDDYNSLKPLAKKALADGYDANACDYDKWDWVLDQLGLKPAPPFSEMELQKIAQHFYGSGGEGEEHKAIKDFVSQHPESVGIKGVSKTKTEYPLPSGDRLDVYFELCNSDRVAIEVKPSISPDDDITRGIFQCVKYTAVMDAVRRTTNSRYGISALLVITGVMSAQNKSLANEGTGVKYIENFKI